MFFNPKALWILVSFGLLVALAVSSNGGTWFHVGEALSALVILLALAGFLTGGRSRVR